MKRAIPRFIRMASASTLLLALSVPLYVWTVVAGLIATVIVIGATAVLAVVRRGGS